MSNILVLYSTNDGHTLKICKHIERVLESKNETVTLLSIDNENAVDLAGFDKIVVGAAIRYGRHSKKIIKFINTNQSTLDAKPNAFFSVNLVARKPEKAEPETNPYLVKFLKRIAWKPKNLAVFAGKVDYPRYNYFDRLVIRFIMKMTNGPTDPKTTIEYTDWDKVERFGEKIGEMT
ncbi:MAG: menaquinone-dependent protoporphyrinogen IX dehydrogenase [Proteobacteria bacterium]|nr:MAG: menaquinone-dependent protoporphyrinogen IX dehydrogenase [Pseudomonadota bacterium]